MEPYNSMLIFTFIYKTFASLSHLKFISKASRECLSIKDKEVRQFEFDNKTHPYIQPINITDFSTVFHDKKRNNIIKRIEVPKNTFCNELEFIANLKHKNIVKAYRILSRSKISSPIDTHYIITEFLDISLGLCNLTVDENKIRKISRDILTALDYLHAHDIAHLDIKPNNIMGKTEEDGSITYKLIDFGFAKMIEGEGFLDLEDMYYGTYPFAPPEIHFDCLYSKKSDIWSFAVTIYILVSDYRVFFRNGKKNHKVYEEFLCGKLPFEIEHVSKECKQFILRCLVFDFDKRPSAKELLLDTFLAENE